MMAGKAQAQLDFVGKDKSRRAFASLNNSLRNTARTLQVVQGPLGPLAGRFTAFATALGTISPAALGSVAGLTSLGLILTKSVTRAAEFQRTIGTLQATLKATGGAAGFTATELDDFAIALGKATLTSRDEVLRAATALSTFGSIADETFKETLRLAQDASQAFGQDLKQTTLQFGKALEDPIANLGALTRIGVSFTSSQKELIKSLTESGDKLEAQQLILQAIANQVQGAGAGAAGGTIGAIDTLGEEFNQLAVEIGNAALEVGIFDAAINNISRGAGVLRRWLFGPGDADELAAEQQKLGKQLIEQTQEVARLQAAYDADQTASGKVALNLAISRLKTLQTEVKILADLNFQRQLEKQAAEEARREKERQDQLDKAAEERRRVEEAQKKRLAKLNDKLFPDSAKLRQFQSDLAFLEGNFDANADAIFRLNEQWDEFQNKGLGDKKAVEDVKEITAAAQNLGGAFGDAFTQATVEGQKFGDVMKSLLSDIAKQLVDVLITQRLVTTIAGGISGAFPGFGQTAAIGGMRSGLTLVGERGPELVNLPRGSKVTPNRMLGGGGVVINNNVLPPEQVEATQQPDGSTIINLIDSRVDAAMNGNGTAGRTFQRQFGLQRQGATR